HTDACSASHTRAGTNMSSAAIKQAGSTDAVKVAFAMEGLKFESLNGQLEMRASDHQLQQPVYIGVWTKVDGKEVKFDQENTGYGWKSLQQIPAYVAAQPTSCQMKRPAKP